MSETTEKTISQATTTTEQNDFTKQSIDNKGVNKKNMLDIYEEIVKYDITTNQSKTTIEKNENRNSEFINILNNYRWTIDSSKAKGTDKFSGNVPFVRINEYKQLYSSQLTNTINSIMSLSNVDVDGVVGAAG